MSVQVKLLALKTKKESWFQWKQPKHDETKQLIRRGKFVKKLCCYVVERVRKRNLV